MKLTNIFNKKNENNFLLKPKEIRQLIDWNEPNGDACIASNRITKDGFKVGYMIRKEPGDSLQDSGWWFYAGDEDEKYSNDTNNFNIFKLNTICNYDPDIIKYLCSDFGKEYIRIDENNFELDDGTKEIYITKQDRFKNE